MGELSKLREVAALFIPTRITYNIQTSLKWSPDCLLGEVTQPSESRLNETMNETLELVAVLGFCNFGHISADP